MNGTGERFEHKYLYSVSGKDWLHSSDVAMCSVCFLRMWVAGFKK